MNNQLKQKVLDKIREIYPDSSSRDIIVLFGSRARGFSAEDSDIDTMIFTKHYDYFKRISVEKGLRKCGEDAGFEIRLDNGLLLETKIQHLQMPTFEAMFYHDILSARPLTAKKDFKVFQKSIKKELGKHYDDLLFRSYVHFLNEFKTLEGMSKRKDRLSKINISMKKGIVVQALLRLILVISKKPFTFDKYLAHEVSKTQHWAKVSSFLRKIYKIDSFDDYAKTKIVVQEHIDSLMPKKPYVGNWWKFLVKFKGC